MRGRGRGARLPLIAATAAAIGALAGARIEIAGAATLTVGPGKAYPAPCAAIAAASDGDTIEIDAQTYAGDVCTIARNNLTMRGVGGAAGARAHLDAAGKNAGGKGTWVITGNNTTVENIEFSGATVVDQNGAGIRQEGANLIIRNCFFHDNDDGILTGANPDSDVLIEHSEFARNGFGDGFSHNMYIGKVRRFTLQFSYSHHAKVGHNVKTRAIENHILYNRIMDEADGTASYAVDFSNGGTSFVIGNLIQQGPKAENPGVIQYGGEGLSSGGTDLYVVNNTFSNDLGRGTFLQLAAGAAAAVVRNNVFAGGGTISTQAGTDLTTNFTAGDPLLVDRAGFDYHLRAGSPCVNAGGDPGVGAAGASLAPVFQYLHPLLGQARHAVGAIDIGAYEFGDEGVPADGGAGGTPGADAGSGGAGGKGGAGGATGSGGTRGSGGSGGGGSISASGGSSGGGTGPGSSGRGGSLPSSSSGCGCATAATARDDTPTGLVWPGATLGLTLLGRRRRRQLPT